MPLDPSQSIPVENVEDYPRPPRLEPCHLRLRVELGGHLVAETANGIRVLETYHPPTYYFPPDDVLADLVPVKGHTFCEWKGVAGYFDVRIADLSARSAAWTYHKPSSTFAPLSGYLAFYPGQMTACFVGDTRVIAQPGSFYGGWVTPNLTGPIKGAPGTRHW